MKKIMILGASILQVPIIEKAKEKGFYVIVLDYNPEAVGREYADEFLCISTIDKESVYQAAVEYKTDYIITSTSDMPVRTVAWVNEKLNRKNDISYIDAYCATNKAAMRKRMKEREVPIPEFYIVDNKEDFIRTVDRRMQKRFVVKPADNAGSRGVILVDKEDSPNYDLIYEYTQKFSRSGEILVEEFMTGPEVSVEAFTVNGVTNIVTITDKKVTELPYFVELGHTEPSVLSKEQKEDIKKVAMGAIRALNIKNGPTHTEIKVTHSGAKLVEIAARLGGDFITSKLVPLSTGVDLIECSLNSIIGEKVDCINKFNRGSAIRFIQAEEGIFDYAEGINEAKGIPGIVEIELYKKQGDKIDFLKNSSDRIGHVIAVGNTAEEAGQCCDKALSYIKIITRREEE